MAKKNLNEDALKTNLDAEVADELVATITPTYKQALDDHKRNKKSKEDAEKERAEATAKAVEVKDDKKVNDGAKKLHLSEDLGDDDIDENTFSAFVHNELFGEHNYKPFLKLPGQAYYYDIEIGGDEVDRADREKVGGSPEDFVVGIRLSGKTPEERKEETRRMRALAKKLDLPFGTTRDKKFAFVLIFDYIARRDANRVMRELDFENVPDKPFIRSDRRVEESKQLNEGPGAGYTITGWLENCKVNSVNGFKDDPDNDELYTGYIVDVDATCELSDLYAESYYHGNGIADNGHVPAKITQIAISAGGLESENPTNDEIAEYVKEELSVLSSDFKSSLGGGWAHTTFEGEFLADLKSDNTYISQVVVVIENKNVIRAIDNATTGEDWVEEYAVLDEDGDEMEFFEDEESAIDFAKKNRGATVEKRELQYTLLGDLESEDIFYENAPVTVWEREYSKSYRYDESMKESKGLKAVKDIPSVSELAKDIENAVDCLKKGLCTCYTVKLDGRLAVCVGWSAGYDDEDDSVIHDNDDPTYAINAGIKVWTSDDLRTDYDFLNFPYYEDGEVADAGESISPNENYDALAKELLDAYNKLGGKKISRDGLIQEDDGDIDESCKSKKGKKALKESVASDDILDDLADSALSWHREAGDDIEDAVARAIDDHLIYDEDIIELAQNYGALDTSDLLDKFYDELFADLVSRVKDSEEDEENDELDWLNDDDDTHSVDPEVDESLKEGKCKDEDLAKELVRQYYDYKFDLETLHSRLRKLFDSNKDAVEWLSAHDKKTEDLEESITIEVDDDDALDMLMDRVDFWAKGDEVALDLYQQMYENWIAERFFDGGKFDVKEIVDNDWVNYCHIVGEDDEHYDEILSTLSNGETDFGNYRIEAQSRDDDGKEVFLIRYIG